jgi:hypothetical protein
MKPIKYFEEFVKEGIVKKQNPDFSRAEFLLKESESSHSFLKSIMSKIGINNENANCIIKLCYDLIMELIRGNMLLKGFNSSGQGAHEAEVAYLRNMGFNENDVQFADQLRYFRNGIVYYGKILDREYAQKVLDFMNKIEPRLKKLL